MFWFILITVFFILLIWILVGPVIIFTDTVTNRYLLSLPGVFSARAVPADGFFHIRGWIFFVPYRFNPFQRKRRTSKKETGKPARRKRPMKLRGNMHMARGMVSAFRIRRLYLDVDTDDVILNAWLVPVFTQLNSDRIRLRANFEGRASLLMDMRTRLGAILWVFIRNQFRRK